MRTLVLQSHDPVMLDSWIGRCVGSVKTWANARGYAYRFDDNAFLDRVAPALRRKIGAKTPVAADLARLYAARDALDDGECDRFIWLDADFLVFDPEDFSMDVADTCGFGREVWVEYRANGTLSTHRSFHNAAMVFSRGDAVLPFLIRAAERILTEVDPDRIAPQIIGPKLLSALAPIGRLTPIHGAAAFSPDVLRDVAAGGGKALSRLVAETKPRIAGANLCSSLLTDTVDAATVELVIDRLMSTEGRTLFGSPGE